MDGIIALVTNTGRVKRICAEDLVMSDRGGRASTAPGLIELGPGERLVGAVVSPGDGALLLVTAGGQYLLMAEEELRPMGLGARGLICLHPASGDEVVSVVRLEGGGA